MFINVLFCEEKLILNHERHYLQEITKSGPDCQILPQWLTIGHIH